MSISPPSDIVLDVARASDPQKYRAAVERLSGMGAAGAGETAPAASAALVEPFTVGPPPPAATAASNAPAAADAASPAAAQSVSGAKTPDGAKAAAAYQKFEAFLLQTFVESMLPKDASGVYGSGTAGDIWRSMFAEHIADELAASAKLGIAERISQHDKRS